MFCTFFFINDKQIPKLSIELFFLKNLSLEMKKLSFFKERVNDNFLLFKSYLPQLTTVSLFFCFKTNNPSFYYEKDLANNVVNQSCNPIQCRVLEITPTDHFKSLKNLIKLAKYSLLFTWKKFFILVTR